MKSLDMEERKEQMRSSSNSPCSIDCNLGRKFVGFWSFNPYITKLGNGSRVRWKNAFDQKWKKIRFSIFCNQILNISKLSSETGTVVDVTNLHQDIFERNRQPEKRSNYLTLVLNDRPFGNALAVSFFRRCARLRLCAYDFHCSIQKRRSKLGSNVSFNESHVLYIYCR